MIGNGASAMQLVPAIVDEAEHVYVFTRSAQWAAPFEKFHLQVPEALRWLFKEVRLYRLWYRLRLFWNFNDKNHKALQRDPDWEHPERALNRQNDYHREYFTQYILEELGDRKDELAPARAAGVPAVRQADADGQRLVPHADARRHHAQPDGRGGRSGRTPSSPATARSTRSTCWCWPPASTSCASWPRWSSSGARGARSARRGRTTTPSAYLGTVVPDLPNFFCLYGPNLQGGHGGSLLTTLEVQARYVRKTLQEMFRRDLGSVECRPEVNDAYNDRIDAAHENMVWTHPGMSTYYRNSRGRVVVNSPWRNVDFWHFARDPDLDEFIVERRQPVPVAGT